MPRRQWRLEELISDGPPVWGPRHEEMASAPMMEIDTSEGAGLRRGAAV